MAQHLRGGFDPVELARRPRRRYNVDALRRLYVEGHQDDSGGHEWPTLAAVAVQSGTPSSRVRAMAARGGWVAERARFRAELDQARWARQAHVRAALSDIVDERAVAAAVNGLAAIHCRFEELDILTEQPREPGAAPVVDGFEILRLAKAALAWQRLAAASLGHHRS
jgi:hypothetical protein